MKQKIFKIVIFIIITNIQFLVLTSYASAQVQVAQEIFLKSTNQKLERLLKDSNEARSFLDEDLLEVTQILEKATIKWGPSFSDLPVLYERESGYEISLSRHYSFMASQPDQLSLVLSILFNLKRQLEVSNSPIPHARINIFSKKFANVILTNVKDCSYSLFPFKYHHLEAKNKIQNYLSLKFEDDGFEKDSKGNLTLWIGVIESSDTGCNGSNQAILTLKVKLINNSTLKILYEGQTETKTCRHMNEKILSDYKKMIKKLSKTFPACN